MRLSDLTPQEIRNYFEQRIGAQFRGDGVKHVVRCPFHQDRKPSLSIDLSKGVWKCFSGCGQGGLLDFEQKFNGGLSRTDALAAIHEALGMEFHGAAPETEPEAIYPYTDEHSRLLFQKLRFPGKRFSQRKLDSEGRWEYNLGRVRKPLYNLPGVIVANQVIVTEGEKDADNVNRLGLSRLDETNFSRIIATTNFDGAGHWDPRLSRYFAGKDVVILPDFDEIGCKHAQVVAASVYDYAAAVKVVQLPGLPAKGDVSDYLESHSAADLIAEIQSAPLWAPRKSELLVTASEFLQHDSQEIEWLIEGIVQRRANGFIVADPKSGKAQPVDTPVLTPNGWRKMGELEVGDFVVGSNGKPTRILQVHPQGKRGCLRVYISDGTSTECTIDHLWKIQSHNQRQRGNKWDIVDTFKLVRMLESGVTRSTHIPMVEPIEFPEKLFIIKPYTMGAILGDGGLTKGVTITSGDHELFDFVARELPDDCQVHPFPNAPTISIRRKKVSGAVNSVLRELKRMGLIGKKSPQKHIPSEYLFSSAQQRMELLRGLLDTDGSMERSGISFSTSSPQMANDFEFLVQSLGGTATRGKIKKPKYRGKNGEQKTGKDSYQFSVKVPNSLGCPFAISRKSSQWSMSGHGKKKPPSRSIVDISVSRSVEAKCITVEAADGLYVTENCIITHNSWIAVDMALALTLGQPWMGFTVPQRCKVALITREDNPSLTKWRMRRLLQGRNATQENVEERLYVNSKDQSPVFKLDVPEQLAEMMAALKVLQPDVAILDVLNILHGADENDNTEMRKVLDCANLISTEVGCSLCVLHHFNKDSKNTRLTQRIRGAGAMAGWVEWVVGVHRVGEESEDPSRWAEFELKAASAPGRVYFCIRSDELAARTVIEIEEAPVKKTRYTKKADAGLGDD